MAIETLYDKMKADRQIVRYDGDFGIEIETECLAPYDPPVMKYWKNTVDNSLRNYGIEYILKQPLSYDNVGTALREFNDSTKHIKFIKGAHNTSVHVHMNVLNDNIMTMGNILTLYSLFEKPLIEFSGDSRKSNLFCLSMEDSQEIVSASCDILSSLRTAKKGSAVGRSHDGIRYRRNLYEIHADDFKYGAVNLSSLQKLGTLEFRSFRGTTNTDEVQDWVGVLHKMQTFARKKMTPQEIVVQWDRKKEDFFVEVFGDLANKLKCNNLIEMIEKSGFEHAARIAYSVKDWEYFITESNSINITGENLDIISKKAFGVDQFFKLSAEEQQMVFNDLAAYKKYLIDDSDKGKKSQKLKSFVAFAEPARPVPGQVVGHGEAAMVWGQHRNARDAVRNVGQAAVAPAQWAAVADLAPLPMNVADQIIEEFVGFDEAEEEVGFDEAEEEEQGF